MADLRPHLATILIFFVSSEYRLPMLLVLLPLAASGAVAVWDRMRGVPIRRFGPGLAALPGAGNRNRLHLPFNGPHRGGG